MNEKNLKPIRSKSEAREKGKKGGRNSGRARREKKTVRDALLAVLDRKIKGYQQFEELAAKEGIEDKRSIKELYTLVCLLNSIKKGDLSDLERLTRLLGEDKQDENADVITKLDSVIGEVDKLAE